MQENPQKPPKIYDDAPYLLPIRANAPLFRKNKDEIKERLEKAGLVYAGEESADWAVHNYTRAFTMLCGLIPINPRLPVKDLRFVFFKRGKKGLTYIVHSYSVDEGAPNPERISVTSCELPEKRYQETKKNPGATQFVFEPVKLTK